MTDLTDRLSEIQALGLTTMSEPIPPKAREALHAAHEALSAAIIEEAGL